MKKVLILTLTLSYFVKIQAQSFIGLSNDACIKYAQKGIGDPAKSSLTYTYAKASSTTDTLSITGFSGSIAPLRVQLKFDSAKQCNLEIWYFNSESDRNTYLQQILGEPKWGWRKLNENQYISDFAHQRTLEVPPDNTQWQFSIIRSAWTRTLYDLLTQ